MIRLALAIGFLAVFGIVAYVLVLLLTNFFKAKEQPTVRRTKPDSFDASKAGNHPFEDKSDDDLDIDVELEDKQK
jgi:hypothetical protein